MVGTNSGPAPKTYHPMVDSSRTGRKTMNERLMAELDYIIERNPQWNAKDRSSARAYYIVFGKLPHDPSDPSNVFHHLDCGMPDWCTARHF